MHIQSLCVRQLQQAVGLSNPVFIAVGDNGACRPAALGFIFSRAATSQAAESALRVAHAALAIRLQSLFWQ